ncbi:MAG: phosphoribosylglycinamide formyltransferase [Bacteroidia bacterium]|nr:phosphoribosylglycinamide formyltransferase [Bacteroidia bacterium]
MPPHVHLTLLASGSGSNAQVIWTHFAAHPVLRVGGVLTNKPDAGVIGKAEAAGIPWALIGSPADGPALVAQLAALGTDLVVLAGYLKRIPPEVVAAYTGRILNIHPSLLPHYGGKGMYGRRVHEAVLAAGEAETGLTIHLVDEQYDTGSILRQVRVPVLPHDTPDTLAQRVLREEHRHYAPTIAELAARLWPERLGTP